MRLTHPTGDQLGILGTEIKYGKGGVHGVTLLKEGKDLRPYIPKELIMIMAPS